MACRAFRVPEGRLGRLAAVSLQKAARTAGVNVVSRLRAMVLSSLVAKASGSSAQLVILDKGIVAYDDSFAYTGLWHYLGYVAAVCTMILCVLLVCFKVSSVAVHLPFLTIQFRPRGLPALDLDGSDSSSTEELIFSDDGFFEAEEPEVEPQPRRRAQQPEVEPRPQPRPRTMADGQQQRSQFLLHWFRTPCPGCGRKDPSIHGSNQFYARVKCLRCGLVLQRERAI
jgi:ribosomal protein S27E